MSKFVCYGITHKREIGSVFLDLEAMFRMIWLTTQEYTKFHTRSPEGKSTGRQPCSRSVILNQGQSYTPENIWQCLQTFLVVTAGGGIATAVYIETRILLNVRQYTGHPPTTRNYPGQSVGRTKIKKPCPNVNTFHYHGSFVETKKPTWGHDY